MTQLDKFLDKLYKDPNNLPANEVKYPSPIETPSPSLNWALNGGLRKGGFYRFEGPESCGKSFSALACVADMLKKNKDEIAIWFDAEMAFSEHYRKIFLPDPDDARRLIVRKTEDTMTGADIFDWFDDNIYGMMKDGLKVSACVVDSINSIKAPKEADLQSTEDHLVGDLSAYLPKAFRHILGHSKPRLADNFDGVMWIFISQVRHNLDPSAKYTGQKYTIPGGKAFSHHLEGEVLFEMVHAAADKIYNAEITNMNDKPVQIGHKIRAKIMKHKFGPAHRVAEFDIEYDKGFVNQKQEATKLAMKLGVLRKDGNTFYLGDEKIAVGQEKTVETIASNESLYEEVTKKIRES